MLEIVSGAIYLFLFLNNAAVLRWESFESRNRRAPLITTVVSSLSISLSLSLFLPLSPPLSLSLSLSLSRFPLIFDSVSFFYYLLFLFQFLSRPSVPRLHSVFNDNVSFRFSGVSCQVSNVQLLDCANVLSAGSFFLSRKQLRSISLVEKIRVDRTLITFRDLVQTMLLFHGRQIVRLERRKSEIVRYNVTKLLPRHGCCMSPSRTICEIDKKELVRLRIMIIQKVFISVSLFPAFNVYGKYQACNAMQMLSLVDVFLCKCCCVS